MKKYIKILFIAVSLPVLLLQSCVEDKFSTEVTPQGIVGRSPAALEALANSAVAYMFKYGDLDEGGNSQTEFGYAAIQLQREFLASDSSVPDIRRDHFHYWSGLENEIGANHYQVNLTWRFYYTLIFQTNNIISAIGDPEDASKVIQEYYGMAKFFRALSYLDLARMYEYTRTGRASSDAEADANNIWGLTVPIVDEFTDEAETRDNPREPFYVMYRFILTDLDQAEEYLATFARQAKNKPNLSAVQALKARFWLEMGTRFEKSSADLQTMLSHENDDEIIYNKMGITTAKECYELAASYARKVINSGYRPVTREEWHNPITGFNEASHPSWVFGIVISSPDNVYNTFRNWIGHISTEYQNGFCNDDRRAFRQIDARLWQSIPEADWRKYTWIDPNDEGKNPDRAKYSTILTDEEWKLRTAYTGFKFRPKNGEKLEYKIACQSDIPLIRVEEMYYIEAEALACSQGLAAGLTALKDFTNNHRYTDKSYNPTPTSVDDFIDNYLLVQKRIELWLEGTTYFDKKRRNISVTRGYPGTSFTIPEQRYNSPAGYAPFWFHFYFPAAKEIDRNKTCIQNPSPSPSPEYLWTE